MFSNIVETLELMTQDYQQEFFSLFYTHFFTANYLIALIQSKEGFLKTVLASFLQILDRGLGLEE